MFLEFYFIFLCKWWQEKFENLVHTILNPPILMVIFRFVGLNMKNKIKGNEIVRSPFEYIYVHEGFCGRQPNSQFTYIQYLAQSSKSWVGFSPCTHPFSFFFLHLFNSMKLLISYSYTPYPWITILKVTHSILLIRIFTD